MNLTLEDWILWAAGFVGVVILLAALFKKGAAKVFPWFTAWCFYQFFLYSVLFLIHWKCTYRTYFWAYWDSRLFEVILVLAVIWQMALALFRPRGAWSHGTNQLVYAGGVLAILVAILLTWMGEPQTPAPLFRWCIRLNLFSAVLSTELAGAVVVVALLLGGVWKRWVTGLAVGMVLWFPISFVVEIAHTYFGTTVFTRTLPTLRCTPSWPLLPIGSSFSAANSPRRSRYR
jgi:hypothetical protein